MALHSQRPSFHTVTRLVLVRAFPALNCESVCVWRVCVRVACMCVCVCGVCVCVCVIFGMCVRVPFDCVCGV